MMTYRQDATHVEISLDQMQPGQGGWVSGLQGPEAMVRRLMEMGMIEDAFVEVLCEAPFGRDPFAVKVRGGTLALRRNEAEHVTIRRIPKL